MSPPARLHPPASAAAALTLTPEQLLQRLWADAGVQVYAVALAHRMPDWPARLAAAVRARELMDFDCLWPGALTPAQERDAPYLLQLAPGSPFTRWLLFEAPSRLGSWGVVATAPQGRLAMRNHLRQQLQARLLNGEVVPLPWMDPEVMALLLPRFEPASLAAFSGPVRDWVVPEAREWLWFRVQQGRLQRQAIQPLIAA